MPELPVKHAPLAGLGAVAAVLALLAGIGGWAGALAGTLAQPLFALAALVSSGCAIQPNDNTLPGQVAVGEVARRVADDANRRAGDRFGQRVGRMDERELERAMLAFINTRRAAGNQTPMAATTDMTALMNELMRQKSIDFWLEGHNMADFRRNPANYPFVLQPGPNYYKPALGPVREDTCWPVPKSEKDNNPNWNA